MKKTEVTIIFTKGISATYQFPMSREEFLEKFDFQLQITGFFHHDDIENNRIVINPGNCSAVEIAEITE